MNRKIKYFFADISEVPPVFQSSYFPSLNGWRGIAILMVVFCHIRLSGSFLYNAVFNGARGVFIFFVLSGFLITTLCIKEKALTQTLSLKKFYIRRALRILPVAYLFIVVIIILNYFFKLNIPKINFIGTSLFLLDFTSYFRKYYFSCYTGHFWTLSVEEQFYLIIPFFLQKSFRLFLIVIVSVIFIIPSIISLQYVYPPLNSGVLYAFTHFINKFQAIAVGCLFSVILFKYPVKGWLFGKAKTAFNIIAVVLISIIPYDDLFNLESVFTGLLIAILIGYLIISNIEPGNYLFYRFLNAKLLVTIGVLSYSIYIWQQIFVYCNDKGYNKLPDLMVSLPFNVFFLIIISCCSYYFYERPFLKLKTKFIKIKSQQ